MNGRTIVFVQNLSANAIVKILGENSVFNSTFYVVTNERGNLIFGNPAFLSKLLNAASNANPQKPFCEFRADGKKYIAAFAKSTLCGWRFYAITPYSDYSRQGFPILLLIIALCVMLIAMGIVLSYIFSLNIYNPIRNIRDILLKENTSLTDGNAKGRKDEIQTIQDGINALSLSRTRNETMLNTFSLNFLKNTIFLLIDGKPVDTQSFLKMLNRYAGFEQNEYLLAVVQIHFNDRVQ